VVFKAEDIGFDFYCVLHRLRDFAPSAHKERQKLVAEEEEEEDDDEDEDHITADVGEDEVDTGLQTAASKDDDDEDDKKKGKAAAVEDVEEASKVRKEIEHMSQADLEQKINEVSALVMSVAERSWVRLQAYDFYHKKTLTIEVCNPDGLLQRVHFMNRE
jgi:hypothetical protein